MDTASGNARSVYKVAWNHPFWPFAILTMGDFFLTLWGAIRFASFNEMNPLAFEAFENGAYWLPFAIKALSIAGVYLTLIPIRQAGMERYFRRILWAFVAIFATVNLLSTVQIILHG